jgi:hypothetical protein
MRGDDPSNERKPEPFGFNVKDDDIPVLLLETQIKIYANVSAIGVLLCELVAAASETDLKDVANHYDDLVQEFSKKVSFGLHERSLPEMPPE